MPPTPQQIVNEPIANYPPYTVACFDPTTGELPRRTLDVDRTCDYLRRLCQPGPTGLLIGASTGQGHLRTPQELLEWFQVAGEANLPGASKMALLRPEDPMDMVERMLRVLVDCKYDVAFVRPGTNLPPDATATQVANHLRPVIQAAAQAGLAVGVYSIPDVSGVRLVPDAVAELLQSTAGTQIVAVKVTEVDYEQSTAAFLRDSRLSRLKIVQGWDTHLARALQDGSQQSSHGVNRCGVTSGAMAFSLFQYRHIFDAAERGDWTEVAAAQQGVSHVFASMQDDPRRFADLQRAKTIMGLGYPLTGTITTEQTARVMQALAQVSRVEDRRRLAQSLNLMQDGPFAQELAAS
ncbi:MAG: dihydrodipicolinate synthase family protein [Planctomycetota bacterium]|nr:dihydrodipicolinate synthase family protein [Planctomycetota bacterium]MDA1179701.1 dihydrodipicolinate synthase family protein [Planctomycetota bacterium]